MYDFFAYILPAVLLVAPAVVLRDPVIAPWTAAIGSEARRFVGQNGVGLFEGAGLALFAVALLYVTGLALHSVSRGLEDALRPKVKDGPLKGMRARPSALVLSEGKGGLNDPVPAHLHAQAAEDFDVPVTASDQQVWWLAYRYLWQEQLLGRTLQFLYLHNLTRALTLTTFLWTWYFVAWGVVLLATRGLDASWVPLLVAVILGVFTWVFNGLRVGFDRSVAEEVFAAYYVSRKIRK